MKFFKCLVPAILLTFGLHVSAQQNDQSDDDTPRTGPATWEAKVEGGEYLVRVASMSAVSKHSYILDKTLVVTEVTIDTTGDSLVRFYYLEPISPQAISAVARLEKRVEELSDRAAGRVGVTEHNMVQKTYPVTTHSKIIEYRVLTKEKIDSLYRSAKKAFLAGAAGQHSSDE